MIVRVNIWVQLKIYSVLRFSCSMPSESIDETSNEHCVVDVDRPIVLVDIYKVALYRVGQGRIPTFNMIR